MPEIRISTTFIGITYPVRVIAYETSTPLVPVATYDIPIGGTPLNFFMTVPTPTPHNVVFYNYTGAMLGAIVHSFLYDPTYNTILQHDDLKLIVDGPGPDDPAAGDTEIINALFGTYDVFHIHRDGLLFPKEYWTQTPAMNKVAITDGSVLANGEILTISFAYKVTIATPTYLASDLIKGIINISANYTIAAADAGNLFAVDSLNSTVDVTLPALGGILNNKLFIISSVGGSQLSTAIIGSANSIKFNGGIYSTIYLVRGETVWIVKNGSYFYVITDNTDYRSIGRVDYAHNIMPGYLLCDGAEYNRADYARLWAYALAAGATCTQAQKISTAVVNGQTIRPYKGCFGNGDGVATFTVPDLMNDFIRSLKNIGGVDAERTQNRAGGFQTHTLENHTHNLPWCNSEKNFGKFTVGGDANEGPNPALGAVPMKQDGSVAGYSPETRSQNIGLVPLIKY